MYTLVNIVAETTVNALVDTLVNTIVNTLVNTFVKMAPRPLPRNHVITPTQLVRSPLTVWANPFRMLILIISFGIHNINLIAYILMYNNMNGVIISEVIAVMAMPRA